MMKNFMLTFGLLVAASAFGDEGKPCQPPKEGASAITQQIASLGQPVQGLHGSRDSVLVCEENLISRDGPKTTVTFSRKSDGKLELTVVTESHGFDGSSKETTRTVSDLDDTSIEVTMTPDQQAIRLSKFFARQSKWDANRQLKEYAVLLDKEDGSYAVYETTATAPRVTGNSEVAYSPRRDRGKIGFNDSFECSLKLPVR